MVLSTACCGEKGVGPRACGDSERRERERERERKREKESRGGRVDNSEHVFLQPGGGLASMQGTCYEFP